MPHITKIRALFFLFFYWVIFNYLVLYTPITIFQNVDNIAINSVQFVVSDAESQKAVNDEDWQHLTLPDDWYQNHKNAKQVWYRAELEINDVLQHVWAIYLPSVSHNAEVYINGIWIGQAGTFKDPISRHHNEPLLFSFSPQLLHTGSNQIDIRVAAAFHEQGLLGEFYVAPKAALKASYQFKHFVRIELIQWITTAMYIIGLILFIFWLVRPQDSIYGIFALEMFLWATHNLNLFISDIPFSTRVWEALTISTFGWMIITMVFFNHRYVGGLNKTVERLMFILAVLGFGFFLLPDLSSIFFIGYKIWDSLFVILGGYALFHLVKAYWHDPQTDIFLMMLAGVPILVLGLHDYLLLNHAGNRLDGLVMQFSVIPTVLLFSWFLIRRFVQSINKAETLAANLEQRVAQKKQELQTQYEKLSALEKQSVLAKERERIMRDMHDGIGGQLVSIVSLLQEQDGKVFRKIKEKIEHSLIDFRFVIDSLDPVQNEIPTMLGMMRLRLNDQLESAKIKLEWAVTDLPEVASMSPCQSLHIMRIVQEAITNCIKHAKCQKIILATGVTSEHSVYIDIIDYGRGMNLKNAPKQGRGISNMHFRAKEIGATLNVESSSEGTRIRLLLTHTNDV